MHREISHMLHPPPPCICKTTISVKSFVFSTTVERAHEGVIRRPPLAQVMKEVRQDDHNTSPLALKYMNLLIFFRASKLKKFPPLKPVSICLCKGKAVLERI